MIILFRNFNEDNKDGFGALLFSNGEKFVGNFENDKIHGNGTFYSKNQQVIQGTWK